jgi:UDP-2,3-diacylglucosamine pyrophosphatase LpxH
MDARTFAPRYRAVFISDVHLGSRGCQAKVLLDFIRVLKCDRLYLVGDIVDGWRLSRSWYWPQSHNDVLQKLLRLARKGTQVIYIPGNHDAVARAFRGARFGGLLVAREAVHQAADGARYLVVHGDGFETRFAPGGWRALVGRLGYRALKPAAAATTASSAATSTRRDAA